MNGRHLPAQAMQPEMGRRRQYPQYPVAPMYNGYIHPYGGFYPQYPNPPAQYHPYVRSPPLYVPAPMPSYSQPQQSPVVSQPQPPATPSSTQSSQAPPLTPPTPTAVAEPPKPPFRPPLPWYSRPDQPWPKRRSRRKRTHEPEAAPTPAPAAVSAVAVPAALPIQEKPRPGLWTGLFKAKDAPAPEVIYLKADSESMAEVLHSFSTMANDKLSFLKPRGLVNTGNLCYMNSILQVLVFCIPFFDFLDQVGKRSAHSFKNDTPLINSMIMFMREFPVIESATIQELRLKDTDLEDYGEPFIPEFVYEVIRQLPRFSSMRRGHQQDAEEFLGFLLEGLHDECAQIMQSWTVASPTSPTSDDDAWLEVGPKQKAAVTRSSGSSTKTPITKIFGGTLRSELRVPGLKNSVTLEPYQPLQLDIGDPQIHTIVDALKGLTRPEVLHGDFKSPKGAKVTATKQVFIETLPPVLILHLKRFQYDNTGGTQKIWKKIGYPLELEIPKEVFSRQQQGRLLGHGGLPRYRLSAVVYHHGKNASGGHYTVDVKRQDGKEWVRLDDTVIRRVRSEDVAEGGTEEPQERSGNMFDQIKDDDEWNADKSFSVKDNRVAYILFYQRMDVP